MLAVLKDITWHVIVLFALLFAVICFLAVLWSKREWNSRKIRVGMFLEREYLTKEQQEEKKVPPPPAADEAPTQEIRRDDAR